MHPQDTNDANILSEVHVTIATYTFAICALLLTPGPTNTLIFLSSIGSGFGRALRLIPFEIAGYLSVIVPLALFGEPLLANHPAWAQTVKLLAAIWIMVLAARLWLRKPELGEAYVTSTQMFVTTLINPKGLIFGLVLVPSGGPDTIAIYLAIFLTCAIAAAIIWAAAGALLGRRSKNAPQASKMLTITAAGWLAFLSATIATSAFKN